MASYRLSRLARSHLFGVHEFGMRRFDRMQADAYHHGLERIFGLLAEYPGIGSSSDDLLPGSRRFRFQSHYVFFTNEGDHILIRAVLHVRQRLRPELFE